MGQLAFTVAGAVAGSFIGMPQLGALVGSTLGGAVFGNGGAGGPRLEDKSVSASTYGVAIPKLYGSARMGSNLIWSSGIKETVQKGAGGKGMGSGQKSYSYTASFAVAFCEGEITDVLRLWGDTKMIFGVADLNRLREQFAGGANMGDFLGTFSLGKKKKKYKIRVYKGTEDQLPDPLIVADKGEDSTPAYRGLCYAVFENFPLEDFGNRIPQISAEITRSPSAGLPEFFFKTDEGARANTFGGYMDYESERMISTREGKFTVYSLRSMTKIASYDVPSVGFGKVGYWQGSKYAVLQYGNSNSRPLKILDGKTFSEIDDWGVDSNSLGENANAYCSGIPYSPRRATFVANGYFHTFRVRKAGGYAHFFWNVNGFGTGSCFAVPSGKFVRYLNQSGTFVTMGEFEGYTEMVAIYGSGTAGSITLDFYSVGFNAAAGQELIPAPECADGTGLVIGEDQCSLQSYEIALPRGGSLTHILYNQSDNTLLLFCFADNKPYLAIYSWDDQDFIRTIDLPGNQSVSGSSQSRLLGQKFGYTEGFGRTINIVDLSAGTVSVQPFGPAAFMNSVGSVIWDDATQSIYFGYLGSGQDRYARVFTQTVAGAVTVGSIVSDLLARTGQLEPFDYDVSDLAGITVTGYLIGREASARDCITQLAGAYFFDAVESDYKLKFVARGKASKRTILENEMGNIEGRDTQLREVLGQETEVPMRITINYMDQSRDYQQASQFAKRNIGPFPTSNARGENKAELPLALTATEAKQMADKALKSAWTNRTTNEAMLPWTFLKYDPTDVVSYTLSDGSTRATRLSKMDIGEDLTIKVAGVNESQVSYVSSLIGDSGSVPAQSAADAPPVTLVLMNTPLLRDIDDTQGRGSILYTSAVSESGGFGGAFIQIAEPGDEFDDVGKIARQPIAGYCATTLQPTRSWGAMDRVGSIEVVLYDTETALESVTYEQLLIGKNLALIGQEVIQFQNAERNDDGKWVLTNILRARRSTDFAVGLHEVAETFILLDANGGVLKTVREPIDENHLTRVRAVSPGDAPDDSVGATFSLQPNDLRPPTSQDVRAATVDANVEVTCRLRGRLAQVGLPTRYPNAEGSTAEAKIAIYVGVDDSFEPWATAVVASFTATGATAYDAVNEVYMPTTFVFPAESLGEGFVAVIRHNGYAPGFATYRRFTKQPDDTWAMVELIDNGNRLEPAA